MINFVIALASEATPIIQHWKLRRSNKAHPFALYRSDKVHLVISGIGKCNSAAATAWLAGIQSGLRQRNSIWINLGIAGHRNLPIGTLICASRIIDGDTGQSSYPTLIRNKQKKKYVETLAKACSNYTGDHAFDMEASGFHSTALKVSTSELCQCLKVISDNEQDPLDNVTAKLASNIIEENIPTLREHLDLLISLQNEFDSSETSTLAQEYMQNWRFSETQKGQLKRHLQKLYAITGSHHLAREAFEDISKEATQTKTVLRKLETMLQSQSRFDEQQS